MSTLDSCKPAAIAALCVLVLCSATSAAAHGNWEFNTEDDGVTLYIRDRDDSGFNELKAITIMECTTDQLHTLLMDPDIFPKIIPSVKESKSAGECGDDCMLVYRYLETPLSDIHYNLLYRWSVTDKKGVNQYTIKWALADTQPADTDDAMVPDKVAGKWKLRSIEGGKTKVTMTSHFNIEGPAPHLLINEGMEDGTIETMKLLRAQCEALGE